MSLLGKAGLRESLPVSSAISCSDKTESKEEDRISVQNRRGNILKSSRGHEKVKKPGLFTVLKVQQAQSGCLSGSVSFVPMDILVWKDTGAGAW